LSDYEELSSYAKPHPKDFRQSIYFKRGLEGEIAIAQHLKRNGGWSVFHAAGVNGEGAPLLRSDRHRSDPVPDLDVSRNGQRLWVEVKTKSHAVLQRSRATYRHGIEARSLYSYWRVQQETGTKCFLVFYELLSSEILCQSLDVLMPLAQHGGGGEYYTERMVFWDRRIFKVIGSTRHPETIPGTPEWSAVVYEWRRLHAHYNQPQKPATNGRRRRRITKRLLVRA
jgi:hypothetical protein